MFSYVFFFVITIIIFYFLVKYLKQLEIYQPIYELTPQTHQAKAKTPSFGGVGLVACLTLGILYFKLFTPHILWLYGLFLAFAGIGFLDDYLAIKHNKNRGLTVKQKFWAQVIAALFFLLLYNFFIIPISFFWILIYIFIIVGASNATNLTDGLDGLLAGTALISFAGFYVIFSLFTLSFISDLLIVMMFSLIAFFIFNRNPAKIFMGDTGSLAIGALLAGLSLVLNKPLLLISLGGIFVVETLSVIIQVGYFKLKAKRIFLMSPLHHHFELLGLSERNVVRLFLVLQFVFFSICMHDIFLLLSI